MKTMRLWWLAALWALAGAAPAIAKRPWAVKAVVVVTFEVGADEGDTPGELQHWVEGEKLTEHVPFPLGTHSLRTNADHSIVAILTDVTSIPAASAIMALGTDPRFDLRKAYWLVGGIAGVDPEDASLGSVAWANYVVTGTMSAIDPREMPSDWRYGYFLNGAKAPNTPRDGSAAPWWTASRMSFPLNRRLADWAYSVTKNLALKETPAMANEKKRWPGYANVARPPFVLQGDSFASDVFWHGALSNQFANDWVRLNTGDRGNFVMTDCEDGGVLESLLRLSKAGKIDYDRIMVLRYGANFSMQPPGGRAADSITAPHVGGGAALENGYQVGSTVLHTIVADWSSFEHGPPIVTAAQAH